MFLLFSGCVTSNQTKIFTGTTMGTTYTIKIIGNTKVTQQNIDNRLKAINKIFSTWDAQSELSLLNEQPKQQWVGVSSELFYMLKTAKKINKQAYNYFDPGIGRLIDLWGFGVSKVANKPNRIEVSNALQGNSIKYLILKDGENKSVIKVTNMHINLSAMAKGYAVDEIAKLIDTNNYIVEIGGEVRAYGTNYGKEWMLGIERAESSELITIKLNNQSIATSGNYRNYFVWENKRYMHIINPNTGLPADSDLTSVSVIHPQAMMADAYATAMMAMGGAKATKLAIQLTLPVVLIYKNTKTIKINYK